MLQSEMTRDVIIIGAGAAGLAAARDLGKAGLSVIVCEARSRIGGRIFTQYNSASSSPIELGAEFIHGKSKEIFSIIEEAHLEVEEVTGRHLFIDEGKLSTSREFWSAVENVLAKMRDDIKDSSFEDFLRSLPDDEYSPRAKEIAKRFVEGFHAAESERIGIHGLTAIEDASHPIDGDRAFRLLNGYEAITNWLQHEIEANGGTIALDATVRDLSWQRNAVEVRRVEGYVHHATAALITIPLSLLQLETTEKSAISFDPPLPDWKLQAIRGLEMGSALRVALHFTDRFWENLTLPGTGERGLNNLGFIHYADVPLPTWWTTLPEHEAILIGWAGGPEAKRLSRASDDEIMSRALESLSRIFGLAESELRQRITKTYFHNWGADEYTLGAYSYLPVNGIEHQLNLAKPVDSTLFFGGEATSIGNVGTVHGAIQSGQRAAREILTALGRQDL
jgi:monoamine oxidase